MINRLAHTIARYLSENGANPEGYDVYVYGLECLLNTGITTCVLLIYGIFMHRVGAIFLWMFGYMTLRINIGGLHASTHLRCILMSIGICISSIYICNWLFVNPYLVAVLLIASLLLILCNQPVLNANHPVAPEQCHKAKRRALVFLAVDCAIMLVFMHNREVVGPLAAGIVSAIVLFGLQLCIKILKKI